MKDLFRERFHLAIMAIMAVSINFALIGAMFMFKEIRQEIAVALLGELSFIVGFFFGQRGPRTTDS